MSLFRKKPRYRHSTLMKFKEKGQYIDDNGYARYIDSNQLVHRYVAEKYVVGRKLLPNEEVHHKNRNKLDNRAKNLSVTTHGMHVATHVVSKILTGRK